MFITTNPTIATYMLLLVVVAVSISSETPNDVAASMKQNMFGSCKWVAIDSLAGTQLAEDVFHVWSRPPAAQAVAEYAALPVAFTRANAALGIGNVKGRPTAAKWANNSANAWQLAPDHPRNNKTNCLRVTRLAGLEPLNLYSGLKSDVEYYVLVARHALLHDSGTVGLACGYFQATEGCETIFKFLGRHWWTACDQRRKAAGVPWSNMWETDPRQLAVFNGSQCSDKSSATPRRVARVVVVAAQWDNNYHHFLVDCLSRLVPLLDFLAANPEVVVHIRQFEQFAKRERYVAGGRELRRRLLQFMGLDPTRFVAGPLLAETAYFPRAVKCNYAIGYAYQIRLLAKFLLERARRRDQGVGEKADLLSEVRNRALKSVVVQQRACDTQAACLKSWREWNASTTATVSRSFAELFPQHETVVLSSGNASWTDCLACQIQQYAATEVLVGLHGAGLTNMIFMPPGSLVVEITGQFDGRMLPLCGYHGALAAVFGVHHYIHYFDWKGGEALDAAAIAREAAKFLALTKSKTTS